MSLARLLAPQSVALVGASGDPQKISGMMVGFLKRSGFAGRVYPVNPKYDEILEWKCYPSVAALPETVDVVVVAVPVATAFEALEQAAARRVPFVVLMTGGFGEGTSGDEGERRRQRLVALCDESGMRVIGPNTVGMVSFREKLPLTFADWYGRDTGQRGGVAILTHSGSVGGLIFSSLQANKVGVDYWIATGNEANLEVADFIDHLSDDPGIRTIACYLEGVMDGRKLIAAARKARGAGKRIVVLKAGSTEPGRRSTAAHTVKRSSGPEVYRGVFEQLGVIEVRSLQELTYCVKLLTTIGDRIGHGIGDRARGSVGILSASGGVCSLIADHVVLSGLELPELAADVQVKLAESIPQYGSTRNPVDLSADAVSRRQILDGTFAALMNDKTVDTWLVFGRPVIDRYYTAILDFARASNKAVIVSSGVAMRPEVEAALQQEGVPVLDDPELCMRALAAVCRATGGSEATGTDAIDRHSVAGALAEQGLTLSTPAGHRAQADHEGVSSVGVAIEDDRDFGPVLILSRDGDHSTSGRVVRALPISDSELRDAIAQLRRRGKDIES